jgi:DUF1009 family protein
MDASSTPASSKTGNSFPQQSITRIGLIAGEGELPRHVARNAQIRGIEVVPFMISRSERTLQDLCQQKGHTIWPGLLRETFDLFVSERITHLIFAGKVNKWILLKNPRLDDLAKEALSRLLRLNDDAVMLWLIDQLHARGIEVLPQSDFLQNLFLPEKLLTQRVPDAKLLRDATYGFEMAREMGRLDIGQTIVVHQAMVIAVEAIEGTDECLKRAGRWAHKKGGVVIKVAKPAQDQRFDIPTVGLRTLKTMRHQGLQMLVTQADHTLFLEPKLMIDFANQHNMIMLSTCQESLNRDLKASNIR